MAYDRVLKVVGTSNDSAGRGGSRDGGGTPPGGGDMDARIRALENGMTDVKVSMGKIETRLDHIEKHMVTKGQMAIWALLGIFTLVASTVSGVWWMVQQYLGPILRTIS